MKLKKMIVAALTVLLSSTAVLSQSYELKFKVSGLEDGTKVELVPFANYDLPAEAEAVVKKGKFTFTGSVPEPREYFVKVAGGVGATAIMLENSKIEASAKVALNKSDRGEYYSWTKREVKGSESHDYYKSQMAVKEDLNRLHVECNEKYAEIRSVYRKAFAAKDQAAMDSLKKTPEYIASSNADKEFFAEVERRYNEVFEANKDTFWGPLMMLNLYSYLTPQNRELFEGMSEEARNSYYGQMVAEKVMPVSNTGEKMPAFTTTDRDGKEYSLEDIIGDNKVLLIDFWASWCGPCKKEIPNLKKDYAAYGDKGFEIVSISIDQSEKAWVKAVEDHELPWPNFLDREVSALYKVSAVPTTYLVDSEGRLIAENLRGEELSKKLEELLD